ncbi:hypothetical protein NGG61_11490 [Enterococcus casseliflavus]|uniref:BRO family protein n=1 Tax=Enterococcus casseliflavus TaxID=37734 RepID=UPI002DB57C8D|nr:BRO family protein [Enterococcus casseliflavus]MEB8400550.1 hypothetical protein [Enterococcus casseliflavus]
MQNLVLAKEELFHGIHCDLWMDKDRNPLMTIQQLANALGYKSKSGIENIISRNSYLREKEFSGTHKLGVLRSAGGTQETIVFTKDGIMEIAFLSNKPKAREFRAWARKVLTAFMDGQIVWKEKRVIGKQIRLSMTDAIRDAGFSPHFYKHFTNLCYKSAIGFNATQIRKARGVEKGNNILDFLSIEEHEAVNKREQQIATLIGLGMDYDQIKEILANGGVIYQTTLKMPEMAR